MRLLPLISVIALTSLAACTPATTVSQSSSGKTLQAGQQWRYELDALPGLRAPSYPFETKRITGPIYSAEFTGLGSIVFGSTALATFKETRLFAVSNGLNGASVMVCVADQDKEDKQLFVGKTYPVDPKDRSALIAGVAESNTASPEVVEVFMKLVAQTMAQPSLGGCVLRRS